MIATANPSLPDRIRLRLDQTLAQWGRWQCDTPLDERPETFQVLGGGFSNYTVLVGKERRFIVRLDGLDHATVGLHRQIEWRALQAASDAGLAPKPRYFNPDLGSLVCDYLPPDENQSHSVDDTARLLRNIHALPPVHHRLDLGERIVRLEKALARLDVRTPPVITGLRDRVHELVAQLRAEDKTSVLCHNDLLAANRLRSGGVLWALDWEYCAMGSPWYDLAVIICGDALAPEDARALVESYLGRTPESQESVLLEAYNRLYRYLEPLWHLALGSKPGEEFMAQRLNALSTAWDSS